MFGSSNATPKEPEDSDQAKKHGTLDKPVTFLSSEKADLSGGGEKRANEVSSSATKKPSGRRSAGVSKALDIISTARNSLHLGSSPSSSSSNSHSDRRKLSTTAVLRETDPDLEVPQGSQNNSAGESTPGPNSSFRVGVTEDRNKKCRKTMEDTHAYLYNFLGDLQSEPNAHESQESGDDPSSAGASFHSAKETDNGYFAIFDGHAGTFAADWCGKKVHVLLEESIRKSPNIPIPELLDQTFTNVDRQLEKLPAKNSGCTAVIAVLRWEERAPGPQLATRPSSTNPPTTAIPQQQAGTQAAADHQGGAPDSALKVESVPARHAEGALLHPKDSADSPLTGTRPGETPSRQRVLYTANVGDARVVLCHNGKALRLSYDHKGSDENEGKRVASAGGLILNNRVNGVLAVTRALGDAYMKDLVTGHPYTTETVIQPDLDEFLILACDGLWDVCSDQEAVDLVRNTNDPQLASKQLVDYALSRYSTDNLSCMIVRFNKKIKNNSEDHQPKIGDNSATSPTDAADHSGNDSTPTNPELTDVKTNDPSR